ncbi:MAG: hypothetical protein WCF14_00785, partial [Nitrososphaeraceae archaeon]
MVRITCPHFTLHVHSAENISTVSKSDFVVNKKLYIIISYRFHHGCILAVNQIYSSRLGESFHEMSISLPNFDILYEII